MNKIICTKCKHIHFESDRVKVATRAHIKNEYTCPKCNTKTYTSYAPSSNKKKKTKL